MTGGVRVAGMMHSPPPASQEQLCGPETFPSFPSLVVPSLPSLSSFSRDHLVQISYINDGRTEAQKGRQLAPGHSANQGQGQDLIPDHRLLPHSPNWLCPLLSLSDFAE